MRTDLHVNSKWLSSASDEGGTVHSPQWTSHHTDSPLFMYEGLCMYHTHVYMPAGMCGLVCVCRGTAVDRECPSQLLSTSFAEPGSLAESRVLSAGQPASGIACVCLPYRVQRTPPPQLLYACRGSRFWSHRHVACCVH